MPKRRRIVLSLVAAASAAAVTVPIIASSAPGDPPRLPDLVADPPDGPEFNVYSGGYDTNALLLRFNGYVHNVGDGPLDLQGNPQIPAGQPGAMDQYLSNAAPNTPARVSLVSSAPQNWVRVTDNKDPVVVFDRSDTHNHFHVQRAAEYTLWNADKTAQVVAGAKVGFCMYDSLDDLVNPGPSPAVYTDAVVTNFCQQGNSGATFLREGISEGWRDLYDVSLDYQWIDVSNIPPGDYYLAARMDPDGYIKEKNEANNGATNGYTFSAAPVRVPGFRANAVATASGFRSSTTVTLNSTTFKATTPAGTGGRVAPPGYADTGTLRYRIESVPPGGTLRNGSAVVTAGTTLPVGVGALTYTPNTNFSGGDTFAYSAVNYVNGAPSTYPRQPAQATASITVGGSGITVGISGVPGQMTAGAQAQFNATTSTGGVTWTVNGVAGGNTAVGKVTSSGLYTAPATVPAGGKVTIQAISAEDIGARSAPVAITIVPSGDRDPRPIIQGTVKRPGVLAVGRNVTVSVKVPTAGTLTVGLYRGSRRLGRCVHKLSAGQSSTCKLTMAKPYEPASLRVRTTFVSGRKVTRGNVSAGGSSFSRVAARRRGGSVVFSVVPKRPGLVRIAVVRRGRIVAQCTGRVLAGKALTCTRRVGGGFGLSVSLKDTQGRLVVRESGL